MTRRHIPNYYVFISNKAKQTISVYHRAYVVRQIKKKSFKKMPKCSTCEQFLRSPNLIKVRCKQGVNKRKQTTPVGMRSYIATFPQLYKGRLKWESKNEKKSLNWLPKSAVNPLLIHYQSFDMTSHKKAKILLIFIWIDQWI